MQCTPESNVYHECCKGQHRYEDCCDSGYSGLFHSPLSINGVESSRSLSPVDLNETPKENIRLSTTPKERIKDSLRLLNKDSWGVHRPAAVTWCETPKVYKRDASLRHRLLMCKPTKDVLTDTTRSPCAIKTETSLGTRSEHWFSNGSSFDSFDTVIGALASSTLKHEQDLPLSSRKRRLLFSQMRTSTLEDGKLTSGHPCIFERSLSLSDADFSASISACDQLNIGTPHCRKFLTATSKENSGFSTLTLDKSQDSSVDHDGSFQELLLSASRRNSETPTTEAKRRSRLQRQHRLSTLKEGGSQSDEDLTERKHKYLAHTTPVNQEVTPLRTAPADLSLTPALQLVHAMCQQKAQMFVGQSLTHKEKLKSAAALAETPVMFKTTMPLAGLIGRKMGLGNVDILTELKKRNLRHILAVILGHLTSGTIFRCGQVCKSWKDIILQDKQANFRRRTHLSNLKATLGGAVPDTETRLTVPKRSALKSVQAQSRTSSYCTPQSGNGIFTKLQQSSGSGSKRDKFLEVAKTLFNDESLRPCPRCQHPAKCHSVKGEGVCSRGDCGFQFCTACLCAFHGSRECGSRSVGRHRNDIVLPGSAQSKRNIRRL
uniref:F-box protein 43 n=1 Tax=Echeneis naucrates TaxID=173247 RepID=A0A665TNY1_ECHNA